MFTFILKIFTETITILADTSVYLLFGFLLAGLIHVYLPHKTILKLFGGKNLRSVINASLFGIPLPLCSCSVLPAAISLKKDGASRGSVFSFLISTPETSIPSVGISFALLDPLMTIFRPIAALITAILAGIGINVLDKRIPNNHDPENSDEPTNNCLNSCNSSAHIESDSNERTLQKIQRALKYSFIELLDDLAPWLIVGLFAAGFISAVIPESLFSGFLSGGILPMLVMLCIGIPLYVCAESSTPIAAALILKGLSPGAAFVFLLVGPATNISSLIVLSKYFPRRILAVYLTVIAVSALVLGGLLNSLYSSFNLDVNATIGSASAIFPVWLKIGTTLILVYLLHSSLQKTSQYSKLGKVLKEKTRLPLKRIAKIAILILMVLYLSDCLFTVPAGNTGMSVSFGKVIANDLQPGLHIRPPVPFGKSILVSTEQVRCLEVGFRRGEGKQVSAPANQLSAAVEKIDEIISQDVPPESELLAGDENLIDIDLTVHYNIVDAYTTTFRIDNLEQLLRDLLAHQTLNEISTRQVSDELTAERSDFEESIQRGLQATLSELNIGVKIHRINLAYSHAPNVVHPAYRDVASATEDKYRMINLAQTDSVETMAKTRGKRAKTLVNARSDSVQNIETAKGQSSRLIAMAKGNRQYRQSQFFRLNAEIAESTLVNMQKFLFLGEGEGALDLIVIPQSDNPVINLPPEILNKIQTSPGYP